MPLNSPLLSTSFSNFPTILVFSLPLGNSPTFSLSPKKVTNQTLQTIALLQSLLSSLRSFSFIFLVLLTSFLSFQSLDWPVLILVTPHPLNVLFLCYLPKFNHLHQFWTLSTPLRLPILCLQCYPLPDLTLPIDLTIFTNITQCTSMHTRFYLNSYHI